MGFARKKKRSKKYFFIVLLIILILGGSTAGGYFWHVQTLTSLETIYAKEIQTLKDEKIMQTKLMLLPKEHLKSGTVITEANTEKAKVVFDIDEYLYINEEDLGKMVLVDVPKGVPILKEILADEAVTDEIREQEMTMVMIPSHVKCDEYVDIRIGFPNGEDYVVLSKKKVKDVDVKSMSLWLWLSEKEILTLSSAVVDAYIHGGTKLYALTYVKPEQQKEAVVNYPVNKAVGELILKNPNIRIEAEHELSNALRESLEEKLNLMDYEQLQEVENGIRDESQQREEVIVKTDEKKERDETITMEKPLSDEAITTKKTEKETRVVQPKVEPKQSEKEEGESDGFF